MFNMRAVILAVAVTLPLTACAAATTPSPDPEKRYFAVAGPQFADLESLNSAADVVVLAHMTDEVGRELDDGGTGQTTKDGSPRGIPTVIYNVTVDRVVRGTAPKAIVVSWVDTQVAVNDYQTLPLLKDRPVLLYLDLVTDAESPGIDLVGNHYVVVGGDMGAFDITNAGAVARSAAVRAAKAGGTPASGESLVTFSLDQA